MNHPSPVVSVIVLNYNGQHFLPECLASLAAQTRQDFELLLVDNASTDGSLAYLHEHHAGAFRLIVNETNLGFAEGNNVAIGQARGRFIAFLNNDVRVDPDWLAELLAAADAHPEAGSFACQVRAYDDPETMDTSGIIVYRDGMSRGLGRLEPASAHERPCEVLAPSGCAAMYRREVLDTVGGFDGDFFAYCEDLDLGFRARLAGWSSWYVPTARVYHHYSGTSGRYSPFKAFLVERNHRWLMVKMFPLAMILKSPYHTVVRYALQAYGVLTKTGASSKFASQVSPLQLLGVVTRACWHTLAVLPQLVRKRAAIKRYTRVSRHEVASWFTRFGISARELALKD